MKKFILIVFCLLSSVGICDELSPLVPFVVPTDKPSQSEITELVDTIHNHGFDQFIIYPGDGLQLEYLSPEYFDMFRCFLMRAKANKMKVWLYDEFNWPSGTAHGRVPAENEDWLYRELVASTNGNGQIKWQIIVSRELNVDNYCFDGNNLEPAAVKRFMELTHFAYQRQFSDYFGTTIPGIFTDEPGHWSGAWRLKMPPGTWLRLPYWSGCEAEYAAATGGRNFRADCEDAFKKHKLKEANIFRVWTQIKTERYRRTYFDAIENWCRSNSIVSTGHLYAEGDPLGCARINGSPLHTLKGIGKPGIDLITSNTGKHFEWITLAMAQSAAHYRQIPGSVELFGLGPCDISFATMRKMYWISALHGIDTFFMALYHTRGYRFLKKDSWAMFTSPAQPWFDEMAILHNDAKEAAKWARKPTICEVALVFPQRTLGASAYFGGCFPNLTGICNELTWNGHNYLLIEEDEPTDKPIVLDWRGDRLFERRSGTIFASLQEAVEWVAKKTKHPSSPGILRRFYKDGSWAEVNITTGAITLSSLSSPPPQTPQTSLSSQWNLSLSGPSKRRLWFWRSINMENKAMPWEKSKARVKKEVRDQEDNTAIFWVDETLSNVRFVLRDYPKGSFSLCLDGKPLVFSKKEASSLVMTFNEISVETEPMELAVGKHIVKLSGGEDGKMFLPVAWMVGEFSEGERNHLRRVPKQVGYGSLAANGLADFCGKATYCQEVEFAEGDRLRVNTGGAVTRVQFAGCDLGAKGWMPFEWTIPSKLVGKRGQLKITISTSIRPIFGSDKHPDAKLSHALWIPSSSADPSPVGLQSSSILKLK